MKVTYNEILNAHQAIQGLTKNGAIQVPAIVALRLARAARTLVQEVQVFEEARVVLVKQFSFGPDEQGNQSVPPARMAEFNKQLAELAQEEIELDIQTIKFVDINECQLPITSLYGMEWLIEG